MTIIFSVLPLYHCKIGRWQTTLYVNQYSTKIAMFLYISKPQTRFIQIALWLSIYVFLVWRCHLFLGWSWFCLSVLLQFVSVPSLLLSFYENFQSLQWDTKWKTSFEFQRPDRTHCLHQPSKGPLDKKVPSELIIHAESPPGCCFLCRQDEQPRRWLEPDLIKELKPSHPASCLFDKPNQTCVFMGQTAWGHLVLICAIHSHQYTSSVFQKHILNCVIFSAPWRNVKWPMKTQSWSFSPPEVLFGRHTAPASSRQLPAVIAMS